VYRSSAKSDFAVAVSNPPNGPSQEIVAVRSHAPGGTTTTVSFYYTDPKSCFFAGHATIPNDTFHYDAQSSLLDVDFSQLPAGTLQFFFTSCPNEPAPTGAISVSWTATSSTRTSGETSNSFDGVTFHFAGTMVESVSTISGSIFGTTLDDPDQLSYIEQLHETEIEIVKN
jgi:hypothetical protein